MCALLPIWEGRYGGIWAMSKTKDAVKVERAVMVRLYRAKNKLYKIRAVAEDAARLLSVMIDGTGEVAKVCAFLRGLMGDAASMGMRLQRRQDAGDCKLDEVAEEALLTRRSKR